MTQEYLGSCNKKNIMILYPVEVEDCNFTPGGSGTGTTYFADETTLHLDGSNTFSIDTGYIGQASITQLGTITSGIWQATPVANAYLANSSLTVSAGTGLTGGGAVSLGGSTSLALSTPVTVANGGTGQTSFAAHGVLIGSGSAALNLATAATAGRLFTDKGAAADPAFVTMGGDATINGSGDLSISKVHGVTYPGLPATNTVPVVTSSNTITYEAVPNAALANSAITINGSSVSLGGSVSIATQVVLSGNTTYYVATTGSNSNNGTAVGTPWLTIQYAFDYLTTYVDFAGFTVTIQVADGTYAGGGTLQRAPTSHGSLTLQGNSGTPANVVINGQILVQSAVLTCKDFRIAVTGGNCFVSFAGQLYWTNIEFGTSSFHVYASYGGLCQSTGNYAIVGNATFHFIASIGGNIIVSTVFAGSAQVTIGSARAFTTFAYAQFTGNIYASGISFTGAGVAGTTGTRYQSLFNSNIYVASAGANVFPGNVAGSTGNGGQYA